MSNDYRETLGKLIESIVSELAKACKGNEKSFFYIKNLSQKECDILGWVIKFAALVGKIQGIMPKAKEEENFDINSLTKAEKNILKKYLETLKLDDDE